MVVLLFSLYSVIKFCHCLCIHPSVKNAFYSLFICLNINFSSCPPFIMKPPPLYLKESQFSGTFLSLDPWSFVKWIIYYWIIYCPVRKQEIWLKTTISSHLFFSCGKSFCTLAWVYKVDFLKNYFWHFKYFLFSFQNFRGGYNFCAPKRAVL